MNKDTRKLIELLLQRRDEFGLSLRKLADATGVSFATLSRLERDETEPDESTKARIANWLGQDAAKIGLHAEKIAEVHFRAGKNLDSATVKALVSLADHIKKNYSV